MKKKISITIDEDILEMIENVSRKQGVNRSQYIENLLASQISLTPALILAGGTKNILGRHKSLLELNGNTLIRHQIGYLKKNKFEKIFVATDSAELKAYLHDNYPDITVFEERTKLGSGGSIKRYGQRIGKRFVLMYCDVLTDLDLNKLLEFHLKNHSQLTLVFKSFKNTKKYGTASLEGSRIVSFAEKPQGESTYMIYLGIGVVEQSVLERLDDAGKFELQINNLPEKYGFVYEGFWKSYETEKDLK